MAKTLFEHLNQVYQNQDVEYFDNLDESDKKSFNVYMINRFISMKMDYVSLVNELQMYWNEVGPREAYLFYSQLLPRGKQFNKYIKGSKESVYEDWVLDVISTHFQVSLKEATEYAELYYSCSDGRSTLKRILQGYGIDDKKIRKAKL